MTRKDFTVRALPICLSLINLIGIIGGTSGCGDVSSSQNSVVKECVLPADQTGTFFGKWSSQPIPIALDQGAFTAAESSAVVAAASTWNDHFSASAGLKVLDYGDAANPKQATGEMTCNSTGILAGDGTFSGSVIIHKRTAWKYSSSIIAKTYVCPMPGNPFNTISNGVIELNYRDYFASGDTSVDLKSILVHEMGHLLGLDHSCDDGTLPGHPSCSAPGIPAAYLNAIMYFYYDNSGRKAGATTALQENDQGRANCIYPAKGT